MKKPSTDHHSDDLLGAPFDDKDALWQLLEEAPTKKASPLFSRNVLREIRLEKGAKSAFWKKLFKPQVLFPITTAALLGLACIPTSSREASDTGTIARTSPTEQPTTLVTYLDEELLLAAADEPSLFSDDEVIAMLF